MTSGFRSRHANTDKPSESAAAQVSLKSADPWEAHVNALNAQGLPEPGAWQGQRHRPATVADEEALYHVGPSFVDLLPWVEYLPDCECLLLEDGESVAAFFDLTPIGTEGRDQDWLDQVRDAVENALQDSFDELEDNPWVVQLYVQDEAGWDDYLRALRKYVHPRAQGTAFSHFYLQLFEHHLQAIAKPGGLFRDSAVTQLPWRGQTRRVRLIVYRRATHAPSRRGQSPKEALATACDRLLRGLSNATIKARRLDAVEIHAWLLRWFNPHPTLLGPTAEAQQRFYRFTSYPEEREAGELELASGTDFSQRLFFRSAGPSEHGHRCIGETWQGGTRKKRGESRSDYLLQFHRCSLSLFGLFIRWSSAVLPRKVGNADNACVTAEFSGGELGPDP